MAQPHPHQHIQNPQHGYHTSPRNNQPSNNINNLNIYQEYHRQPTSIPVNNQPPISNFNNNINQNQNNLFRTGSNPRYINNALHNQNEQVYQRIQNRAQMQRQYQQQVFPHQYMQPEIHINNQSINKMDGIYAQTYKSVKSWHILHFIILFVLEAAVITIYHILPKINRQNLIQYIVLDAQMKLSIIPFIIIFQLILLLCKVLIYHATLSSLDFAIKTAQVTQHSVVGQPYDKNGDFQQNTSKTMYIASAQLPYGRELDSSIRSSNRSVAFSQINTAVKRDAFCTYQFHQIIEFAMLVCGIYLIVCLTHDTTRWFQKLVIISTIVYWFLVNYKFVLVILALALSPLIIIIVIIIACVWSNSNRPKPIKLPQTRHPTNQEIINAGGTCSICMMQFSTNDEVVFLPCSDKHMFHNLCISGWMNVKTTCPNCRHDLSNN